VLDDTAIAVSVAVPETVGSPCDVTVNVDGDLASSAAFAGTATFTHTSVEAPGATVGVVVIGVVQLASYVVDDQAPVVFTA
jgi:hypothetical protein